MTQNHELISRSFRSLLQALAPYVCTTLRLSCGDAWWKTGVMDRLFDDQKRNLPESGPDETLCSSLDIQRCLLLVDLHWQEVFRKRLSPDSRSWVKELINVRNRLAHMGAEDFNNDDTWRALDTMSRLCEKISPEATEEIRALLRQLRYGSAAGSTTVTSVPQPGPAKATESSGILAASPDNLPSWREVIEPHPDVAQGRYIKAEFAADLAQVARGEGSYEYLDPVEFFARTYITEGLSKLLVQSLKRVSGKGGEPVIQLKTAFGGGKTHSMLALYHLLRGTAPLEKIPSVRPVLEDAGLKTLPNVHVAVLVGTALSTSKGRELENLPGVTVNTLWGEIAAQLALSTGNPKLYDIVKEADKKGVSPGSVALKSLFDACGSCLILMDELVAYARSIYGVPGLPAGSYDNFITFIQQITEAARASQSSLVVASIPESDSELGGDAGRNALNAIEHTFGRMEVIWKPVAANEGFEVVRRRLFLDCKNEAARDMVCAKFSQMYYNNPTDFPPEAREDDYRKRLIACYPIHPEVFDRLYKDWATLERFQRTRGVLRLMAAVIHELWMGNDAGLLIMPGSLPLDAPSVRDELIRYLPESWNGIVDSEVDGKNSVPFQVDRDNPRYGKALAARRVARAIMLGSAPSVGQQTVRGIEASRLRLGVVQPGESIALFNDARSALQNKLAYLYANASADRFWYDTRPTLRKTVEDRASQIPDHKVELEIEQRLKKLRREAPLAGVHICPASSLDVPDEQAARLVLLRPAESFASHSRDCSALLAARKILDTRGDAPRIYKNTLVFLAPDESTLETLSQEVRHCLAWKSIEKDSDELNLDKSQIKETKNSLKRCEETVDLCLKDTWCWLLVPRTSPDAGGSLELRPNRLGGGEEIIKKTVKKLVDDEAIIAKWAPALLLQELDSLLWQGKEHLGVKQLWEYLCTYCYLPRLAGYEVLEACIRKGLESEEYFGYAAAVGDGHYIDLVFGKGASIDKSGYLVKASAARAQKEEKEKEAAEQAATKVSGTETETSGGGSVKKQGTTETGGQGGDGQVTGTQGGDTLPPAKPRPKRFYLSSPLDATRVTRDVQRLLDEIVSVLSQEKQEKNVSVNFTLDIQASAPEGFPQDTVRAVSENCRTLKISIFGFDKED